jgi:hypothetical protein
MIRWTRRAVFIKDAANMLNTGSTFEEVLSRLGEYAEPVVEGTPLNIGTQQLSRVRVKIYTRLGQLQKEDARCIHCNRNPHIKG